jgi:[ribosomal protein S18]-alanine N-acetyltransferase
LITTIAVRRAAAGDLGAVVSCLAEAFEPFRAAYTHAAFEDTVPTLDGMRRRLVEMTILVAEAGPAGVVGTIAHQVVRAGEGHLRGMAVLPGYQGQGVAGRLLLAAEADLRAAGCARVTLDTTEPLERAIRFYRRNGYAPTGVVTDFFGMRLHEYAKELE